MTETPDAPHYREPGVRYRKVRRERIETTVIDGRPSTRRVPYTTYEALPPRDWDEIIRRGVAGVAIAVSLLAAAGTTASVGGLLSQLVHPGVAYSTGLIFTASWLACLGIEYVERVDANRAARARNVGWVMLLIGMAAVITYGQQMHQLPAGVVGSSLDLAAKGLWWLIMGLDRVKLDPGVANWVAEREQEMAGRFLLGTRLGRLNRRASALRDARSPEFEAAEAILASATKAQQIAAGDSSGQGADTPGQSSGAPQPPAPPAGGPTPIGGSIAGTVRQLLDDNAAYAVAGSLDDAVMEQLTDEVRKAHGDRPNLKETVRRTRDREIGRRAA
ncbi:hypothetical protein ACFYOF_20480 [Streptomyces sp. NPDC007148]|uniref:hypothetical protein n=1 Tax=Streptomyces sp. NPDC007148 TaxID=3364775 RepID=UPI0036A63801